MGNVPNELSYDVMLKPFIGKDFHSQDLKLLFIGESHYAQQNEVKPEEVNKYNFFIGRKSENTTSLAINGWLEGEYTMRFFGVIFETFKFYFNNTEDKKSFYNKIAFANYVQDILLDTRADILPFISNDNKYKEHFLKVASDVNPDYVILLSQRLKALWDYNGISDKLNKKLIFVKHPSGRGYTKEDIRQIFEQAIK